MGDYIETVNMNVEVQANGIIRNDKGRIIARTIDDVEFEGEHIYPSTLIDDLVETLLAMVMVAKMSCWDKATTGRQLILEEAEKLIEKHKNDYTI